VCIPVSLLAIPSSLRHTALYIFLSALYSILLINCTENTTAAEPYPGTWVRGRADPDPRTAHHPP